MPRLSNDGMALLRTEGETQTYGNGHWQHPWLIRNILCPDGRRRTAYLGPDADTFFSWPARVKIAGRWVKGFVSNGRPPAPLATLREIPEEPIFHAQHNGHPDGETPDGCVACWLAARIAA